MAQTDNPTDETQAPPAVQEPAVPREAMQDELGEPAAPILDEPSEMSPQASPDQPSESATPPSETTEAPKSILPEQQAKAPSTSPQFLRQQGSGDWLASDLLGKAVVNTKNETIGDVDNLVTDANGKIVALVIGVGGFLGLGEKEVAVRFEDLELSRDENSEVKVMANFNEETLVSAPDFETLHEQDVAGSANENREEQDTY
jgi:sporulation protein YlmC with PRC-barrel domain